MDSDIQFGELEEEQPDVELRPDKNRHYAIVAYGEVEENDLPIFVDLDVLIEMESHALTDTSVELGGVMLGGQLHDDDGNPYVLVVDSLRAQHYQATKGSFKFTHDTWQQITRDRDEFPSDWDMVGWYHTHPDWGVFLSGMDMFICDNFFNKPLDVALVIDPCRQDRGFFMWNGGPGQGKRRVGGFYVIASRHREAELTQFVAQLEDGLTMRTDPNLRGSYGVTSSGGAPTIVNITEQKANWMGPAVMGMLAVQFLTLMFIAWLALRPPQPAAATADGEKLTETEKLNVRTKVLDDVMKELSGGPDKVVSKMQEQEEDLATLKNDMEVIRRGVPALVKENESKERRIVSLTKNRDDYESKYEKYRDRYSDEKKKVADLEKQVKALSGEDDDEALAEDKPWWKWFLDWRAITIAVVVAVGVALAAVVALRGPPSDEEYPQDDRDEPPTDSHQPPSDEEPLDREDPREFPE